ncbi:MAG: porin family protein [Prevotella sp.]|uniref:porin family protein n=1 Tax=Prevotella sp. TaxID=59823 RepID=UPI002A29926C|nr:porin family protein [Prevotella sp.]MDD7317244.1 porin family protein [Prevotellaceae bacterium]MDY4019848.1 porin family protein [Prevotella sp.]
MKKTLLAALLIISSVAAFAQKEPGTVTVYPKVGINLSKYSGDQILTGIGSPEGSVSKESEMKCGFSAGVDFRYRVSDNYGLSAGLVYANLGNRFEFSDMPEYDMKKWSTDNRYLQLPIMMQAFVVKGLSVNVGIQPAVLLASHTTTEWVFTTEDKRTTTATTHASSKDWYKTFEFSIPLGVSYEYRNLLFDLCYHLGLMGIYKFGGMVNGSPKISAFTFSVAYGLDL